MAAYFLSPALAQLRAQINAAWPNRDRGSDGWIGDASHAARKSDHNPDWDDGGIVRAIDVDKDGIDVDWLIAAATGDSRTSYVIWQGRIWQRSTGRWSAYTGVNRHDHHVHISVRHGGPDRDASAWGVGLVSSPVGGGGSVPTAPGVTAPAPITPISEDVDVKILTGTSGRFLVGPLGHTSLNDYELDTAVMVWGPNAGPLLNLPPDRIASALELIARVSVPRGIAASVWATTILRDGKTLPAIQELADIKTIVSGQKPAEVTVDIDEDALAASISRQLAPLLSLLPDADLERIAEAVNDEASARLATR